MILRIKYEKFINNNRLNNESKNTQKLIDQKSDLKAYLGNFLLPKFEQELETYSYEKVKLLNIYLKATEIRYRTTSNSKIEYRDYLKNKIEQLIENNPNITLQELIETLDKITFDMKEIPNL